MRSLCDLKCVISVFNCSVIVGAKLDSPHVVETFTLPELKCKKSL